MGDHDATGDRLISAEGSATAPRLSADFKRVYYLLRQPSAMLAVSELRVVDLASGTTDCVLPGLPVDHFDVSRDEREVVFTTPRPTSTQRPTCAGICFASR